MTEPLKSLASLAPNESAVIVGFDEAFDPGRRERFEDLGLIPDTTVTRLYTAPMGDPAAFLIGETVLCLRKEDSSCVFTRRCAP